MKVDDLLTVNAREKAVVGWDGGGRGEPEANNLVCTKRRKHIYAIRKHETTLSYLFKLFKFVYTMHNVVYDICIGMKVYIKMFQ